MPTNAINDTGVKYLYDKLHGEIEPIAEAVSDSEVTIEGNPLSFNTLSSQNAKSTILSLEPIQDLHGYDKPWVGGAGKNKFPSCQSKTKTVDGLTFKTLNDGQYNIKGTTASQRVGSTKFILENDFTFPSDSNYSLILRQTQLKNLSFKFYDTNDKLIDYWTLASLYERTISTFTQMVGKTCHTIEMVVDANPATIDDTVSISIIANTESDKSYEPYENICPISGRTKIGILGCGKNLCDELEDGGLDNNGLNSNYDARVRTKNFIPVKAGQSYVLSVQSNVSGKTPQISASYYEKADYTVPRISYVGWSSSGIVITIPDNILYIRVLLRFTDDSVVTTSSFKEVQIEKNNQATEYEPYTESNDLTIDLGQTVYGGTLDVENGVLVVDRGSGGVNNTWTYSTYGGKNYITQEFNDIYVDQQQSSYFPISSMCEFDRYGGAAYFVDGKMYQNNKDLYIQDSNYTTKESFISAYSDCQIVYYLATPITINLTPHTINLLKGVNNISTDGDKITLTYRDGSVATLGDLTSAVDNLDSKIDESKILTDTATGDKYILVVTNGVLSVEQISN